LPSPSTAPIGQSKVTHKGNYARSALDANYSATGSSAVGTISSVGEWRRMEQTCPAVAIGARALLGTIQGVPFDVVAHEDCPERVVEFVRALLFEMPRCDFGEYADTLFAAVRYGFAPHEIVSYRDGGLWWLRDLGYRPPNSFDLQTITKRKSGWMAARQRFYDENGATVTADYDEPGKPGKGLLLWPTYGDNGGPLGEGFYRPLYAIYREWADAVRYRRIATQKAGLGTYVVQYRENMEPDEATQAVIEARIAEASTHQSAVLTLPASVDAEHSGWQFSEPEAINALTSVINDCETRIFQCFGAQYAARGITTQHGSFSASKVDADELSGHRSSFVRWLSRAVQPVINFYVELNFGQQKHYPYLVGDAPREISPTELVGAMVAAKGAGLLVVDSGVRGSIRLALQQEPEGDEAAQLLEQKQEQADALREAVANKAGESGDDDEDADAPDERAPDGSTGNPDDKATMAACSCATHFAAGDVGGEAPGVRAAPRPGGQDRITGPGGRDLSALERLVRWPVIKMTLDSGEATVKALLMAGREDIARYLLGVLDSSEWETANDAAGVLRKANVPSALVRSVSQRVMREMQRIADTAVDTVEQERARQVGNGAEAFAAAYPGDDGWSSATADQAADEAVSDTRAQLVRAALSVEASTRQQVLELLASAADDLSAAQAGPTATLVTTETFARARDAHVKELVEKTGTKPQAVWYSAILDANTCEECAKADQEFGELTGSPIPWGSPLHTEMMPPYQRCLGGVRCRCQLIYQWS
jgi:hypothetical protein